MILALLITIGYIVFFLKEDKTNLYIYNLGVVLCASFLGLKLHMGNISLIYHIIPFACFLTVVPFWHKYAKFILFNLVLLILYLIFKELFWNLDTIKFFAVLKNSIFCSCIVFSFVENARLSKVDVKRIVRWFYMFACFQAILAIGQYLNDTVNSFFYVVDFEDGQDMADFAQKLNMKVITGTLISPSALSLFFACTLYILFIYETYKKDLTVRKSFLLLTVMIALFLTGIRTPILMLVLFITIYLTIYRRDLLRKYYPVLILLLIPLIVLALQESEGAIARLMTGITQISSGVEGLSESTFFYTMMMIPYFLQDPIFGVSLYKSTGYPLFPGIYVDDMSVTDLYLLYLLCEIGLIGVILYLKPLFQIIKYIKIDVDKTLLYLIIFFGVSLGIVDQGIFHYSVIIYLLYGYCFITVSNSIYNGKKTIKN